MQGNTSYQVISEDYLAFGDLEYHIDGKCHGRTVDQGRA